ARLLSRARGRACRAAAGPGSPPPDPPIALGASAVHTLPDARGARDAHPGGHGRGAPHVGQAPRRGRGDRRGAPSALALVLAGPSRRTLAVPRQGRRAAGRRRARGILSMSAPRLLVIMGSGETAPTMVTPHREIVARFGRTAPRAVLLDTPYGFQENA